MKTAKLWLAIALTGLVPTMPAQAEGDDPGAASFDGDGSLILPENFEDWVFIGTSLGMGYSQAAFYPEGHNMFKVARQCGFVSEDAVRHAFSVELGVTPREYRLRFGATTAD